MPGKQGIHLSVYETYNGLLADMRREGATLQEIGNLVGITREGVRQSIKKHYGEIKPIVLNEQQVARQLDVSPHVIAYLRKEGKANPRRTSGRYLYSQEDLGVVRKLIVRYCRGCGVQIYHPRHCFCAVCAKEACRYSFPFFTPEQQKRHNEATNRWRRANPERMKPINQRAVRKFRVKWKAEHYAKTLYEVCRGSYLPVGLLVKAKGCEGSYLVLEDDSRYPVSIFRKVKDENTPLC